MVTQYEYLEGTEYVISNGNFNPYWGHLISVA
jgi:hypothetical protein